MSIAREEMIVMKSDGVTYEQPVLYVYDNAIAYICKKCNISQRALARECKIHQSIISYCENGKRKPTLTTAKRIVDYAKSQGVDITLDEFVDSFVWEPKLP
jgi:predicted transcriptional regulator